MNKVVLIGNIGKDAEVKGKKTSFSLATSENWKDRESGEKKSKTTWHNIVMWDASEALTQYLTKGTKLAVEGKIVNYQYEKDSVTMYGSSVEPLRFGGLEFLGGGSRSDEPRPAPSAEVDEKVKVDEDEFPF